MDTPAADPTKTPFPTGTLLSTPSDEDIQFAESLQVTYTAIPVDMLDRREAFFAGIQECEIAPRTEGWREFRVEEVGLTMQFPGEWSDYDYRTDSAGNLLHGSAYGWFGSSSL